MTSGAAPATRSRSSTACLGDPRRQRRIRNRAIADGEMAIAEEQYYSSRRSCWSISWSWWPTVPHNWTDGGRDKPFGRIQDVQKKSFQETSAIKDAKRRLKQRCEDDLKNLHDAIQKGGHGGRGGR
ncbi:hypothetical protein TcBrA4_0005710 [Trypanosoma cruzi]|nr:hypothetical protein TcBrA4_0005710 [Trypanosoma cruzi]